MIINASIQVIPIAEVPAAFALVDEAIALIQQSGIKFSVGAFETTLEGEYEDVQQLIRKIEDFCYRQKHTQFLVYKKLHVNGSADVLIANKTEKFHP